MVSRVLFAPVLVVMVLFGGVAMAGEVSITGLAYDPVDLFETEAEDADIVGSASAGDFSFPTRVLETSDNGMLKVRVSGGEYWVIADDVETDASISLQAACEPEMQGATVSFGARGLGEGC